MSNNIQSCLSPRVLEQIGRNEVSPDELITIEEHLSECPTCREMFDRQYTSSEWSEHIQPALSESTLAASSIADEGVDHSSAILKLLGPTDDPNMLGRIGNYEIVGVIGQGGMGAVFKGYDRSLNRFVAIKMLLPHLAASGAARKRFAREGQAVAAVVDDHVMAIHCVDQWQGIPYLVMTYSRGVSLQKRLNDHGPLGVREILRIGMQAAKGLAAAHAQGIVHRDIKPSNILLDQNVERVQLVDFGLARAVDDASLTCSGTLAGTPQYMSPEQARAESVDHRSDLFSLGSVLYAMCAGYAPFRADSSYGVLRLIIEKEPRPIREVNSDIPDWLCAIIGKLMAKQAGDRFESAKQVADLLEACLAYVQQPTTVPLPSSAAELANLVSSTTGSNRTEHGPNSDLKLKAWRRFIGPPIGKYVAAAAAAAAVFLAGVVIVLELNKGTLTIKSVADNVPIRILRGKDTVQELTISKQGRTTRLRAGTYTVEIEGDSTEYKVLGDNVTVKRGEDTLVNISIDHGNVVAAPPNNSIEIAKPPVDATKANKAATVVDVELLLTNLDYFNNRDTRGYNTERSVKWGRILIELTNIGSAAVPKIIERLDQTEDDRMIASLAFVLRVIGDKRGVPALIRAIPKTLVPSPCNWIQRSQVTDSELDLFFRTHRFEGQGDAALGCSNSHTELRMALASLADAEISVPQTYGSGTERQVYLQRQLLYKNAKQWADWWEQNSSRFVDDVAYAKVELNPFTMAKPDAVAPDQLLDKLFWQTEKELPFLQSSTVASNGGYSNAFIDLDTGRSQSIPQRWREKQLSESDRTELLAWAEKEGLDLVCDRIEDADRRGSHFVLRGIGLKAWQIDDKWWKEGQESSSWSEIAKGGRSVVGDRLIPYEKEKNALDPSAVGLFLFVTNEGTPGLIYVGAEVTDDAERPDTLPVDWLLNKNGFVKGRRFGLRFFESNAIRRAQGSPPTNLNAPGNAPKSANFEDYWDEIERTQSTSDDSLTAAIERFNKGMHWTYPNDDQPPLTKDELIAYASWNLERDGELPATYKVGLAKIAKQHQLPENWTIDGFYGETSNGGEPVSAFQINLKTNDRPALIMPIRRRFLAPPTDYSLSTPTNNQGGTPLASAVKRFNARHSQAAGIKQPPLSEDEVVAAIIYTKAKRDDHDVSDSLFERFQNIAHTRQLPEGVILEVIPTFGVEGGSTYTIWSIRITMLQDEPDRKGWTYGFLIREQFVSVKHGDAGAIHWGTPAENGLQAGVRLSPSLKSYQFGQKISVELWFRNILTKTLPANVPNFPSYEVEAHDKDGAKLESTIPLEKIVGGWRAETIGDQPLSLRGRPLVLLPSSTSSEERAKLSDAGDVLIFIDQGKSCRLQLTVSNYGTDGNGTLKTGEFEFSVDAHDSQAAAINVDNETGVITIKGSKENVEQTATILKEIQNAQPPAKTDLPDRKGDSSSNAVPQSDSLEGVWEASHPDGTVLPNVTRLRIVFTKDKQAVFHGTQKLWTSSYAIEPEYSPKRLRYVFRDKPMRGIYEVKDGGLRLSVADESEAIPTKFGTEHAEFKRLEGDKARELIGIVQSTAQTEKSAWLSFPDSLHGKWIVQDATTLTAKRPEYIGEVIVIDQDSFVVTESDQRTLYRLSHWKHRDDNQTIEADLTPESTDGEESKATQCLIAMNGDELVLLRQRNEHLARPKNVDDISTSITRFTMAREKVESGPEVHTPLEAIEIAKRFANDDHGQPIRVKFRVLSVHPPFVPSDKEGRGHSRSEFHLDFRPLPADFAEHQFLVVLTQEAVDQLKKLGIENIKGHFPDKEIEATGRVVSTMHTARGMPGRHFHLIVSDLKQIALSKQE